MALSNGTSSASHDGLADENAPIMAEINITPLTDIFLVLLIIFMVTSSVMSQMGVQVQLPQASQKTSEAQPDGVIVSLLPDGHLQVNGDAVDSANPSAFQSMLKAAFAKSSNRLVVLEGDQKAFLGSAVQVMDEARKAGAERFAIATAGEAAPVPR